MLQYSSMLYPNRCSLCQMIFVVMFFFIILTNCMKNKNNVTKISSSRSVSKLSSSRSMTTLSSSRSFPILKPILKENNFYKKKIKLISSSSRFFSNISSGILSIIFEFLHEDEEFINFNNFFKQNIPHAEKKLNMLPQRLTKNFLDYRFYNLKTNFFKEHIIEYFYPKNSPGRLDSSCSIFQIFVLKFCTNHMFTLILHKNGNLEYKSSAILEKRFFNTLPDFFPENWQQNIFSISLLTLGTILAINKNLGIQISINCFLVSQKKLIVQFGFSWLNHKKQYLRASPYLGFSHITFLDKKLSTMKYHWDKKKNLISSEFVSQTIVLSNPDQMQVFKNESRLVKLIKKSPRSNDLPKFEYLC